MRRAAEWSALGLVIAASLWLWRTPGCPDIHIWERWLAVAVQLGLRAGYVATANDYPPGSTTLLWLAGRIGVATGASVHDVLKSLAAIFLLASTGVVLAWTKKPLFAAFAFASLAVGAVSLVYLDVLCAPFLLGAIWAASRDRRVLALVLLTIACAIKWQPGMVVPFAIVYACLSRRPGTPVWLVLAQLFAIAGAIVGALFAYFGWTMATSFYHATGHHHISAQGLNVGWILTGLLHVANPATFGPLVNGESSIIVPHHSVIGFLQKAMFGAGYLAMLIRYWRSRDQSVAALVRYALAGYLVYFALNSGVHENHLQTALMLGLGLAALEPRWTRAAIVLAVCSDVNLIAFYGVDGPIVWHVVRGIDWTVWLAFPVMGAMLWVWWTVLNPGPRDTVRPLQAGA